MPLGGLKMKSDKRRLIRPRREAGTGEGEGEGVALQPATRYAHRPYGKGELCTALMTYDMMPLALAAKG
jgi:hypothetical protein